MAYEIKGYDGCEHYSTTNGANIEDILADAGWSEASSIRLSTDAGTGSYSFQFLSATARLRNSLNNIEDVMRVGLALRFKMTALPSRLTQQHAIGRLINIYGNTIGALQVAPSGRLLIKDRDNNILGTSSIEIAAGVWNHFDFHLEAGSGGEAHLRLNGVDCLSVTAQDFQSLDDEADPGNFPPIEFATGQWSGSSSVMFSDPNYADDYVWYIPDTVGVDYVGLYGVYYLQPIADETPQDWSLSTGVTAYTLIDEIAPDGDSEYIYTANVGDQATVSVEELPVNIVAVAAVAPIGYMRKTDSGDGSIVYGVLSGSDEAESPEDIPLLTDYGYAPPTIFTEDPATTSAWDPTGMPKPFIKRTE